MKQLEWELLHPRMTMEHLGYIPEFLYEDNPKSAKEQIDRHYVAGWNPFNGFSFNPETQELAYPGDPSLQPLARTKLREETIIFYPHSWVAIIAPDGTFDVARLD